MRVVDVVEGVPILERLGVTARGRRSLKTGALTDFAISLWPRSKKTTAQEINDAYKKALKAEGVEWRKAGARITFDLNLIRGYYLLLTVESWSSERRNEDWPSPSFVGKAAQAALEEFSERLVIRHRGPRMFPENLIPAMVAYLLRSFSVRPKEINELLKEHVLHLDFGQSGSVANRIG